MMNRHTIAAALFLIVQLAYFSNAIPVKPLSGAGLSRKGQVMAVRPPANLYHRVNHVVRPVKPLTLNRAGKPVSAIMNFREFSLNDEVPTPSYLKDYFAELQMRLDAELADIRSASRSHIKDATDKWVFDQIRMTREKELIGQMTMAYLAKLPGQRSIWIRSVLKPSVLDRTDQPESVDDLFLLSILDKDNITLEETQTFYDIAIRKIENAWRFDEEFLTAEEELNYGSDKLERLPNILYFDI